MVNNQQKIEAIRNKCVFCNLARHEGVDILCMEPLNPVTKGHLIVFSAKHSIDFMDNVSITMAVMEQASKIAKKLGGDFNLITSKGKNATQSVFHLHLHVHLVPRSKDDGLKLPWTNQIIST